MPIVNILGFDVFIPDLSDLTNFIVQPITNFINSAFTIGSAIVNTITISITSAVATLFTVGGSIINSIVSGITGALSTVASVVISGISALITGITSTLTGVYNYLTSTLSPLILSVLSTLAAIPGQITSFLSSSINAILSGVLALPNLVTTGLSGLSIALGIAKDEIINHSAATGQALLMTFDHGLGALGQTFEGLPGALWGGLQQYIIEPARSALTSFFGSLQGILNSVFGAIQSSLFVPVSDVVHNPFGTVTKIIGSILGIGTTIAIPMIAGELIHPLKQIGLSRLAAYFWDLADFKAVGGAVLNTITQVSTVTALRQGLNLLYRPNLPDLSQADQMFFNGALPADQLRELYGLHGWRDEHIDAWFRSFYSEPSDRMLIDLITTPGVPEDWIDRKLTARGYREDDRKILQLYGLRKKILDEVNKVRGVLDQQYGDGLIVEAQYVTELKALGLSTDEILWSVHGANLRAERQAKIDQVNALRTAFRTSQITEADFTGQLAGLVPAEARRAGIIALEKFRRRPSKEPSADRERKLTASQLSNLFVTGVIDEARLRVMLGEIRYAGDDLELLVADANRRKAQALLSESEK